MKFEDVAPIAAELTAFQYFPTDEDGRLAIMKLIGSMASSEDQVRWLVKRMLNLFDQWPGPRTLRIVFCKKYKPLDGVDLRTAVCEQYPEGIPDESPEYPPFLALPRGQPVTADPQLEAAIEIAIRSAPRMPKPGRADRASEFDQVLRQILHEPDPDTPDPQVIDIKVGVKLKTGIPPTPPVSEGGTFIEVEATPDQAAEKSPITEADVESARAQLPEHRRCPHCRGTGRYNGAYCYCPLGRDLYLVERG